ncbi:SusD/RagB family nutrient-binding outer membrane lipoprotein [Chitinophaga sp. sic0106]|uniref:SusD/RagB family nutrient-binding outer membrane lipoprotein n=1 Tax=Chitinophaga sp. sic0106 TaxID=2854785 RepID=UPI001C466A02|nr:SusD/RagB family nutrient-binding outer membrane lipoprotein [Chitinophaga sp. sic0106]MBV7533662.1 SusD/RagB family nutrient-binding outer membrane lipoprotein [Chitinophaga sp. sic0106]
MKRICIILLGGLLTTVGCTKGFLDINTDPNNPSQATSSQLLTASEQGLAYALGFSNSGRGAIGFTEVLAVYMHQVTVRESQDQYGAQGDQFDINNAWTQFYSAQNSGFGFVGFLENTNVLIRQADEEQNHRFAGIGRILKAYGMSQMVDLFGDVPFTEANQFYLTKNGYPKFDDDAAIYPELLKMLDTAIGNLSQSGGNSLVPGSDDLFYGGNVDSWTRLAKSIKLKMLVQQRLIKNVSAEVSALFSDKLISKLEQSFMMPYGPSNSPDDRNPGFNDYFATQRSHYVSPWFYSILKGYNPRIFTNIEDPRIPYYFYNQMTTTSVTPADSGKTDYRDSAFVSILFGSVGPNRDRSNDNGISVFGIYPVGGRYDDNYKNYNQNNQLNIEGVSSSDATGAAPLRLLTYADVLYLKAECINAGLIAGDARATLEAAIQESFLQVDYVATKANKNQTIPKLSGSAAETDYINKVLAFYDGRPTNNDKLEVIMTQKWIQSYGFSCDQYSDYRRTGFPILFNPNDPTQAPGGFYQPPIFGDPTSTEPNHVQPRVRVVLGRNYPLSLPYPADELNVNRNAPPQKQPDVSNVFWDPK